MPAARAAARAAAVAEQRQQRRSDKRRDAGVVRTAAQTARFRSKTIAGGRHRNPPGHNVDELLRIEIRGDATAGQRDCVMGGFDVQAARVIFGEYRERFDVELRRGARNRIAISPRLAIGNS